MEPTTAELIFWIVSLIVAVIGIIVFVWPWRDPREDDPYRYCPKEEDEW